MLTHLRDELPRDERHAVRGYRGGYLPSDRREIERGLRFTEQVLRFAVLRTDE